MDLGPQHQLICNHYTLRQDASTDFLRSWVLQVGCSSPQLVREQAPHAAGCCRWAGLVLVCTGVASGFDDWGKQWDRLCAQLVQGMCGVQRERRCAAVATYPPPPLLCISFMPAAPHPRFPQGSNDGVNWADLRRHISDGTVRMPGQYASWAVTSHAAAVPYRYFRLLLVGPNPEAANRYHMCLSYWELCE